MGCVGGKPKNEDAVRGSPQKKYEDHTQPNGVAEHAPLPVQPEAAAAPPRQSQINPQKSEVSDGNSLNYHPPQQNDIVEAPAPAQPFTSGHNQPPVHAAQPNEHQLDSTLPANPYTAAPGVSSLRKTVPPEEDGYRPPQQSAIKQFPASTYFNPQSQIGNEVPSSDVQGGDAHLEEYVPSNVSVNQSDAEPARRATALSRLSSIEEDVVYDEAVGSFAVPTVELGINVNFH